MTSKTQWVALTDTGLVREHNEDSYFLDQAQGIAMVADGMGGHEAGEVASALAVEEVQKAMAEGHSLAEALLSAHKAILNHPQASGKRPMGTTGVAIQLKKNQAEVAWVGDSRAYLFDGQSLQLYPLTRDHTPVQDLVEAGKLTKEQARTHPKRNEISQALGMRSRTVAVKPGVKQAYLDPGSVILLCSDGLTTHVPDEMIADLIRAGTRNLEATARRLMDAALDDGGSDNITLVLVKGMAG